MKVSVRQSFGDSEQLFRKQKALLNFLLVVLTVAFQVLLQQRSVDPCFFIMDWLENEEVRIPMVFACEWEWFWRCLDQHAPECSYLCY